jgi:voltage-gated sodium channel
MFHIFNIEIADLIANVTILRTFRLFKIFRTIRIIPNASKIYSDFKKAFKATYGIVIGGIVVLIIIGVVLCCIFKNFDPDNFGDPIVSIYTVFRLFSVEGWYEIPDAMSVRTSYWYANGIRVLFSFIVLLGIFLLGFIISSMSDELTMDNNDELIKKTTDLEGKIDELNRKIDLLVSKK